MNWKVLAMGGVLVIPLIGVLAINIERQPRFVSNALEGECPRLEGELETLEGESVSLSELRGAPVVVNFWSTFCQGCEIEHDDLVEARRRYQSRGVEFYGVMWHDTLSKAGAWLQRNEAAFPILVDPGDRLAIELGVSGVPETFVIGSDGCVIRKFIGPVTANMLASELEPLL